MVKRRCSCGFETLDFHTLVYAEIDLYNHIQDKHASRAKE